MCVCFCYVRRCRHACLHAYLHVIAFTCGACACMCVYGMCVCMCVCVCMYMNVCVCECERERERERESVRVCMYVFFMMRASPPGVLCSEITLSTEAANLFCSLRLTMAPCSTRQARQRKAWAKKRVHTHTQMHTQAMHAHNI